MGVRAASRGAWTGATIAMPDELTGALTNGADYYGERYY